MVSQTRWTLALAVTIFATLPSSSSPTPFTKPFNESPVRGAPGDILVLAGEGFLTGDRVVYRRLTGCAHSCCQSAPTSIPGTSTANCGEATVVAGHAQVLNAQLPTAVVTDEVYALTVFRSGAAATTEIKINDARPRWVSPSRIHVSTPVAGVQGNPRSLKVVGRNLQPRPGAQTQVRIRSGFTTIAGPLGASVDSEPAMNHYVARVNLPSTVTCNLPPCTYTVEVSRDSGASWVAAPNTIQVLANPQAVSEKDIANYGCSPNDGQDDTSCLLTAIASLAGNGGGTAVFGAGEWLLAGSGAAQGITLPPGVNLKGQGPSLTRIRRAASWHTPFVFIIERGPNTIEGIHFDDDHALAEEPFCNDTDATNPCTVFVVLSNKINGQPTTQPIEGVTITNNRFEDISFNAIGDKPHEPLTRTVRRLYITNNTIEAFFNGLAFIGNSVAGDGAAPQLEDSIITGNQFHPGEYKDVVAQQGTIATGIGAGRRLDFSGNVANRLDLGNVDRGWRAAYFWHMANSHEDLLISKNEGYCTGSVAGDGEFIALDSNAGISGFPHMVAATAAGASSVTVSEGPNFEIGYWIQVVDGRGLGQTRKVTSCSPACTGTGPVTINISPDWDVKPDSTSRLTAQRQYWQLFQVANKVDIRDCWEDEENPGNENGPDAGYIGFFGTAADSTVEANDQWGTNGIAVSGGYSATGCHQTPGDPEFFCIQHPNGADPADCTECDAGEFLCTDGEGQHSCELFCPLGTGRTCIQGGAQLQYFNEIRGNLIDQEVDFDNYLSWSGVNFIHGSIPWEEGPTQGYGVVVAHNQIIKADALFGGGVGLSPGWYEPPAGDAHFRGTVVHHNVFTDIRRPDSGTCYPHRCYNNHPSGQLGGGVGIHIRGPQSQDTVIKDNTFTNVCYNVKDFGTRTVNYETAESLCPTTQVCPGPDCAAGGSCTETNSGLAHCDDANNVSFNCPCTDDVPWHPPQSYIHQETCPCTGGLGCPTTQQELVCLVP